MALLTSNALQDSRMISGRCAIYIGDCDITGSNTGAAYSSLGTMKSVGIVDGSVDISANQSLHLLSAQGMSGPHAAFDSDQSWQVTFNLQEFDVWNLALALSLRESNMTGSQSLAFAIPSSKYRSLQIKHFGAENALLPGVAQSDAEYQFFKVKVILNGSMSFERKGKVEIPVIAHCLQNDVDKAGQYITTVAITNRSYE